MIVLLHRCASRIGTASATPASRFAEPFQAPTFNPAAPSSAYPQYVKDDINTNYLANCSTLKKSVSEIHTTLEQLSKIQDQLNGGAEKLYLAKQRLTAIQERYCSGTIPAERTTNCSTITTVLAAISAHVPDTLGAPDRSDTTDFQRVYNLNRLINEKARDLGEYLGTIQKLQAALRCDLAF